jgi:hypothetical protein
VNDDASRHAVCEFGEVRYDADHALAPLADHFKS